MTVISKVAALVLAIVSAYALAGCTAQPEPVDPYEQAHTMCIVTMDLIAETNQPEAAEAWHEKHPGMCTDMAEGMGKADFIDTFLDPATVARFIEEQT